MVNLAECIGRGELDAEIVAVISSRSTVAGVERAGELGVEPAIIRKKDLPGLDDFSAAVVKVLDEAKVDGRKSIFGEIFGHNAVDIHRPVANLHYRWCIVGDWKLIVPNQPNIPDGENELYDLAKDPHEEKNLATECPDRVEKMMKMMKMIDQWWEAAS